MLVHPQFNPIAFSFGPFHLFGLALGPFAVHWYGITYMVAFGLFVWLAGRRAHYPWFAREGWTRRDVEDLLFFGVLGVVVGGRLGYVIFYQPQHYAAHLGEVIMVWKGGMSFHGGLVGVIVAMALFAWSRHRPFLQVADLVAPCVPLGLASGRIGNFINGELWGRFADPSLPWAMVFPQSGSSLPRHPSQLYEVLGEGLLLFALTWIYGRRERGRGQVSGVFLMGYGVARFIVEFFREPDNFIGVNGVTPLGDPGTHLVGLGLSMGQWLCVPMLLAGAALYAWGARQPRAAAAAEA
jgi:phosphatidylglycerol:prolipoprotein diacylglycerol transferase